jgi:hypothetical protein
MSQWTGGCLCGAVRYFAKGEPLWAGHCHCKNCRKMSGAAFVTFAGFPPERFEWTKGEIAVYAATPDYRRGFCRECGSSVVSWRVSEVDKWIAPFLGSLDRAEDVKPQLHIFAKGQLPWLHVEDGLPRYARWPEEREREIQKAQSEESKDR